MGRTDERKPVRGDLSHRGRSSVFVFSLRGLLAAALLICGSSAACAGLFTEVVAFGDSLSDVGNVWICTGYIYPPSGDGYYQGRFSNGYVWVERLAENLSLTPPTASLPPQSGTNFAFGGAETGSGYSPNSGVPNLGLQVSTYLESVEDQADPDALYTVWSGANDFLFALGDDPGDVEIATCAANLSTWASNVSTAVDALYEDGAVTFLVLNLPGLGDIPRLSSSAKKAEISSLVEDFNSALSANLQALEDAHPDLSVRVLDVYDLLDQVLADPGSYGFTNVTDPAMTTPGADPVEYVFWDDIHPTAAAHALLGAAAAQGIPEPGTLVLLMVGAVMWMAATAGYFSRFRGPRSPLS